MRPRARLTAIAAFAAAMAVLAACSASDISTTATAAPTPATAVPAQRPERGIPASLAFDTNVVELRGVPKDETTVATFLAVNRGAAPLRVGPPDLQVERGCDNAATATGTMVIPAGDLAILPVRLGPHDVAGEHEVTLSVPANDPGNLTTTLTVRFVVEEPPAPEQLGPRLRVDKEEIDIGVVAYDRPLYEQFILTNAGDEPLTLDDIPKLRILEGC